MSLTQIISEIGIVVLLGAIVWLIRLEGVVKRNAEEIKRLKQIEEQTLAQEIRIKQRDEEMRNIIRRIDKIDDLKIEANLVEIKTELNHIRVLIENNNSR